MADVSRAIAAYVRIKIASLEALAVVSTFIKAPPQIIDNFLSDSPASEKVSHGLFLIYEKIAQQQDALSAIEDMRDGFRLIAENLALYAENLSRNKEDGNAISMMSDIANINRLNDWFDELQFQNEKDKQLALQHKSSIIISMKAILWDLLVISGSTDFVPFVLDGEVTYLSAYSAEGKAIRRIRDLSLEDAADWIVVESNDHPIDLDDIRSRLASRGYKVLAEDSPSSY